MGTLARSVNFYFAHKARGRSVTFGSLGAPIRELTRSHARSYLYFAPHSPSSCVFAVDGPNSPAAEPFVNTVYKVLPAGATPSAKFPPSWIDQTMKKIEEFGEEVLAKFEEVTAKSKA